HEMGMYKQYSGLIASGRKTTGIRGGDGSRKRSKEGGLLRFECREEKVLTRITRRRPAPRHTGYPPARARSPGRGRDRNRTRRGLIRRAGGHRPAETRTPCGPGGGAVLKPREWGRERPPPLFHRERHRARPAAAVRAVPFSRGAG